MQKIFNFNSYFEKKNVLIKQEGIDWKTLTRAKQKDKILYPCVILGNTLVSEKI